MKLIAGFLFLSLQFVPDGRRLVTGAHSGEFTLWNGTNFSFESILQVGSVLYTNIAIITWWVLFRVMTAQCAAWCGVTMVLGW